MANSFRDKSEGTYRSGEGWVECLLCDGRPELLLGESAGATRGKYTE